MAEIKMKWIKYLLALVAALPILVLASPVLAADIPQPDSAPTVLSVAVYHNLRETGDSLFLIYARIPYATIPVYSDNTVATVDEAYSWRIIDPSGNVTGFNTMYPYRDFGYGYNIASLYFDNTTTISWYANYTIQLIGMSPAFITTTPSWSFTIPISAWEISTDQTQNQLDLAANVISLSATLDRKWLNTLATSLLSQGDTEMVLSLIGQYFWNGAIQGLQAMAPTAYDVVIGDIITTPPTWSDNYTQTLATQWGSDNSTAWIVTAQQGGADFFGTGWDLMSTILVFAVAVALVLGNIAVSHDGWNGLIDVSVWLIFAARLGLFGLAFLGLLAAIAVVVIALKLWGVRG